MYVRVWDSQLFLLNCTIIVLYFSAVHCVYFTLNFLLDFWFIFEWPWTNIQGHWTTLNYLHLIVACKDFQFKLYSMAYSRHKPTPNCSSVLPCTCKSNSIPSRTDIRSWHCLKMLRFLIKLVISYSMHAQSSWSLAVSVFNDVISYTLRLRHSSNHVTTQLAYSEIILQYSECLHSESRDTQKQSSAYKNVKIHPLASTLYFPVILPHNKTIKESKYRLTNSN